MNLFAIFGNPVSHSKSPLMHNLAFKGLGHDACYTRYRLKNGAKLRETFFGLGLKGVNVTVPHKEYAYAACDHLDPFARKVGAVNTIIETDGELHGYNTDAPGFLKAISEFKNANKVLFLGAGGTARSTSTILRDEGYEVTILNRSGGRLESFKEEGFKTATFENFDIKPFDLIINMTSAGLEDDLLPAPLEILNTVIPSAKACIDVIYGKDTPFLRLAKSHHKPTKDGSDMLLYQGIIAFEHFTAGQNSFEEIKNHMKRAFLL
jgi:shikimate dehydrogenase